MKVIFPTGVVVCFKDAKSVTYEDGQMRLWSCYIDQKKSNKHWIATIPSSAGAIVTGDSRHRVIVPKK